MNPRLPVPVVLGVALLAQCSAQQAQLGVGLAGPVRAKVSIAGDGGLAVERIVLYRSTSRIGDGEPDMVGLPVTVFEFPGTDSATSMEDSMLAHNATYYYRARLTLANGAGAWTNVDSVVVPDTALGRIAGSSVLIDKRHYFLEVRDGGRMKKRYPVALGRDPKKRKLHRDNATTPEGIYKVNGVQSPATFYKALDIDYPNDVDRSRYSFAKSQGTLPREGGDVPGIGSEIQIHGGGIERNWTNGCIALRNADMDELLAHPRVGADVPVFIVGTELSSEDLSSIQDYRTLREIRDIQHKLKELGFYDKRPDGEVGTGTRLALGSFQRANALPATCDFDSRTIRLLVDLP
jgi:hypothetical protein